MKNTLTKVLKSHTLKMGGEITHMTFVDTAPWSARPSYYFNNMWDFLNDAPSTENATFDPRSGVPTDFRKDTRQTLYALFVQDNYKMRPNLTLTFGLRWEYFGSISEKNDNLSSVVLGRCECADRHVAPARRHVVQSKRSDFGPQVGATWSPDRFNDKMVLRGGFGIGYNGLDQAISLNGRSNPPFLSAAGNLTGSQIVYGVNSFPADVHSFSGYASNPATIANFDPNTNLPVPGPNFALVAVPAFPPSGRQPIPIATPGISATTWAASGWPRSDIKEHDSPPDAPVQPEPGVCGPGHSIQSVVNGVDWYANDANASFNALLGESGIGSAVRSS